MKCVLKLLIIDFAALLMGAGIPWAPLWPRDPAGRVCSDSLVFSGAAGQKAGRPNA